MTALFKAAITGMLFLAGSFSYAATVGDSDAQVKPVAQPIIEAVVDSYNNSAYSSMAKYFGDVMFADFPQVKFEDARARMSGIYGENIISCEYLGYLSQSGNTVVLYRASFTQSEALIKLVLSKEGGKVEIIGLWFE